MFSEDKVYCHLASSRRRPVLPRFCQMAGMLLDLCTERKFFLLEIVISFFYGSFSSGSFHYFSWCFSSGLNKDQIVCHILQGFVLNE